MTQPAKDGAEQKPGIQCRRCGCTDLRVRNTRPMPGGKVKRYRVCRHCGKVKVTTEG